MNKKDYKRIAKILKIDDLDISKIPKEQRDWEFYKGMAVAIRKQKSKIIQLADYFEKNLAKTKGCILCNAQKGLLACSPCRIDFRKQFLKDCGVVEK